MDFKALLDLLDKQIEKSAKKLNTKLLELLENNGDLNTAFASFTNDFWADFLKAYNKANNSELNLDELMNLRADKITLSKALYTELREVKNSVQGVIKRAFKEQKSANELAKMLYEGYDFKADPLKVKEKYPKYLWEKSANTKVKNIKTPALRAAYSKLLKDESKLVTNQALKIAGYEKARYYAKRIALNETARAYNDARAFEYANSKDIQVVKIQMSKTHPRTDICDYYASVDKYGLGAGVYPKHKAPVPPFHPFCRCQMIPKYAHEYPKPKLNANADKEYLDGLKEWQRARILGSKRGAKEALKTGDINSVFNAMKPERYKVKNIDEVAEFQKQNGKISALNKANKAKEYNLINATKEQITQKLQNGFSTKERELYVLGKTSIFGSGKRLILSSDTIQSHTHHEDIAAADYAQIIDIMSAKLRSYNDKKDKRAVIILAHNAGNNYRLVLKNIPSKDEVFVQSLSNIGHRFTEIKRVIKKTKNKG